MALCMVPLFLMFSLRGSAALTASEISAFTVTGSYDATVSVDATTYAAQNRCSLSLSPSPSLSFSLSLSQTLLSLCVGYVYPC